MFRPSFETLEKREVFSAGPLVAYQVGGNPESQPTESMSLNVMPRGETFASAVGKDNLNVGPNVVVSGNAGNDALQVAAGDVNGDGRPGLLPHNFYGTGVYRAINRGGDPLPFAFADGSVRYQRQILPYIEQDNIYKSSAAGPDIIVDDVFYLNGLYQDLHAQGASDNANDIIFARHGQQGTPIIVDFDYPLVLIGTLLPVVHRPGQGDNTHASVTDLVIDPLNSHAINWGDGTTQARGLGSGNSSPPSAFQASIVSSQEYFQALGQGTPASLIGTLGGIWKTNN
jgi:hypothetical protein